MIVSLIEQSPTLTKIDVVDDAVTWTAIQALATWMVELWIGCWKLSSDTPRIPRCSGLITARTWVCDRADMNAKACVRVLLLYSWVQVADVMVAYVFYCMKCPEDGL